jgi:hypothetical protein
MSRSIENLEGLRHEKLDTVLDLLEVLNKLAAVKTDDGKVDSGEVVEILPSVTGAAWVFPGTNRLPGSRRPRTSLGRVSL